jgi:hypothetical protein
MLLWVRAVNWVAAATSLPALSAAVSNVASGFIRPIVPSGLSTYTHVCTHAPTHRHRDPVSGALGQCSAFHFVPRTHTHNARLATHAERSPL